MYGIVNHKNEHIDASTTLHGAKCYATRNSYDRISKRCGYNIVSEWEKVNNKWAKRSLNNQ